MISASLAVCPSSAGPWRSRHRGPGTCKAPGPKRATLTTTVYSMAPCARRVSTVWATVEPFWPIATYMHFTPWPRWLMTVSMATEVLPVFRSPIISSRWPRPMGVIASMALIPVCRGCFTGWRDDDARAPGSPSACPRSRREGRGRRSAGPAGRRPGPERPSPTGTERILPVARTSWPSSSPVTSPSTTAPMESSSRLRASAFTPPSSSRISFTATLGSPVMLAMPSPISRMRPTSSPCDPGGKALQVAPQDLGDLRRH